MTTDLVHNGGQRSSASPYPTFTWNAAGSWTNSYGEIRSYSGSSARDLWENTQKLDITVSGTTYYVAYKPNDAAQDAAEWPSFVSHGSAYHLSNGSAADWWDRFISFDHTAFQTALSNSSNGTFSSAPTAPSSIAIDTSWGSWSSISPTVQLVAGTHTSTHYHYHPSNGTGTFAVANGIKCDKTTLVWSDADTTGTPSHIERNSQTLYLSDGRVSGSSGLNELDFTNPRAKVTLPSFFHISGGGSNPLSNNSSSTSSKKVFHNFW